jgi:hypothetical protein
MEGGIVSRDYYQPVIMDMGGGNKGVLSKATLQAEFNLDSKLEDYILLGEEDDNTNLTETSDFSGTQIINSGFGIWHWADQLAQDLSYNGVFDYNDFYDISKLFESQDVMATRALMCMGPELGRFVEQAGLDFVKEYSGGSDLLDQAVNRLGITVNVVRLNDIEFILHTFKSWAKRNKYGMNINDVYSYEFPEGGLVIPEEKVDLKVDQPYLNGKGTSFGAGQYTFPNLFLGFVNKNGENRERIMKWRPGVNGLGIGGNIATVDSDGVYGYWLTEMMCIAAEVNKWIKIRKII